MVNDPSMHFHDVFRLAGFLANNYASSVMVTCRSGTAAYGSEVEWRDTSGSVGYLNVQIHVTTWKATLTSTRM